MTKLNIETFFNTQSVKRVFFPGRMFWGKDCRYYLFDLIGPDKTIAFFVDAVFAQHEFVLDLQKRYGRQVVLKEKIEGMPETDNVNRIVKQLAEVPDMVISIGGGSTIDTAKAVIATFIYGTFDGIGMGERRGIPTLDGIVKPVFISLPTTPGTGADASRYYVVYDSKTRAKTHGKSWELIADWILLDASFIQNAPDRLLINSAFDAFMHLFESYLCRYERSWFGGMLSLDGIGRILHALDRIINHSDRGDENLLQLLYASTIAGMAISNVRTGGIHEAAGALLEHTKLTHPETLFVFMRETCRQYDGHIKELEAALVLRLQYEYPELGLVSLEEIIKWWENIFEIKGITAYITEALKGISISGDELEKYIFDRVFSDKVWIEKESPVPLDSSSINRLVGSSLKRFGL